MADFKKCPYCAEEINKDAIKCKHCGEILDLEIRNARTQQQSQFNTSPNRERKWNPGVAGILSLVIPGTGQMYKGEVGLGVIWLIVTILGYCLFIIPGMILHLICVLKAASGDPYKEY
jgi:hypothetical protein